MFYEENTNHFILQFDVAFLKTAALLNQSPHLKMLLFQANALHFPQTSPSNLKIENMANAFCHLYTSGLHNFAIVIDIYCLLIFLQEGLKSVHSSFYYLPLFNLLIHLTRMFHLIMY